MIGSVTVVNVKTFRGRYDYIGRSTILGNPFPLPQYTREHSIALYKQRFAALMEWDSPVKPIVHRLINRVLAGEHLFLACHCKPLACHGDVIKKYIDDYCLWHSVAVPTTTEE